MKQVTNLKRAQFIFPLYSQKESGMAFFLAKNEYGVQIVQGFV